MTMTPPATNDTTANATASSSSSTVHDRGGPALSFSQVPGNPSFRKAAVNAVAVVPLLLSSSQSGSVTAASSSDVAGTADHPSSAASTDGSGRNSTTPHSLTSFADLWQSLRRHSTAAPPTIAEDDEDDELLLVVPNSSLTRPGDWRYQDTPLQAFHWGDGCQRLLLFDGRPHMSRPAHDRILNQSLTRDWIDLCPARRTAAVVGVLNLRDCNSLADLQRAEEELHQVKSCLAGGTSASCSSLLP
jgi:hypothetical protein